MQQLSILKILQFIFVTGFLFLQISCKKTAFTAGEIVKKIIIFENFDTLEINDEFNVFLLHSDTNKIEIRAAENIIENIDCTINNKLLSISDSNKNEWFRGGYDEINIYISTDSLSGINILSSCKISTCDTLRAKYLTVRTNKNIVNINLSVNCYQLHFKAWNATGEYRFSGNCTNFYVENFGYGYVNSYDLYSRYTYVYNYSTADCDVRASEKIIYEIYGNGNVNCKGKPANFSGKTYSQGKFLLSD